MKRTFLVTVKTEIEVDIPDSMLTEEAIKEFEECLFPVDDDYDLFKYAAEQIAQYKSDFIEWLGEARSAFSSKKDGEFISYKFLREEVDAELSY